MNAKKNRIGLVVMLLAMCLATQAFTCNTAAVEKWIEIVLQGVETVGPLISPLVGSIASLAGKTLTTAQVNAINGKLTLASADLSAMDVALMAVSGSPDQTTLGKLDSLEASVSSNLNDALLQANGIKDQATQTTIVNSVQALIATAQEIQALIPASVTPGQPPAMRNRLTPTDLKSISNKLKSKAIKAAFNAAIKPTGNPIVDAAFAPARAN
jgi:hypothetical protein